MTSSATRCDGERVWVRLDLCGWQFNDLASSAVADWQPVWLVLSGQSGNKRLILKPR